MVEVLIKVLLCIALLGAVAVITSGAVMGVIACIDIVKDAIEEWRKPNE